MPDNQTPRYAVLPKNDHDIGAMTNAALDDFVTLPELVLKGDLCREKLALAVRQEFFNKDASQDFQPKHGEVYETGLGPVSLRKFRQLRGMTERAYVATFRDYATAVQDVRANGVSLDTIEKINLAFAPEDVMRSMIGMKLQDDPDFADEETAARIVTAGADLLTIHNAAMAKVSALPKNMMFVRFGQQLQGAVGEAAKAALHKKQIDSLSPEERAQYLASDFALQDIRCNTMMRLYRMCGFDPEDANALAQDEFYGMPSRQRQSLQLPLKVQNKALH